MRRSVPGEKRTDLPPRMGENLGKRRLGDKDTSKEICREKTFATLRQRSVDKAAEFISDVDIRAKSIATIHQKFLQSGYGGRRLTEEVALELLNRVARGEQLTDICKESHLPSYTTVMKWIREDPDFQSAYMEAKEFQMNVYADEILSIADDSVGDIRLAFDKMGNLIPEVNYENVKRSELKIKTRQWLMERFAKKQFSSKEEKENTPGSARVGNVQIQIMLPDNGRNIQAIEAQVVDV